MEKKEPTRFEVVIAGLGGQGLLTAGKILIEAGVDEYEHVFYLPNYGPAMRSGECECTVTLSNEKITAAGSLEPPASIVMGAEAFKQHVKRLRPGGKLFVDSSLVKDKADRDDIEVFYIPATKTAVDIGSPVVSNLVLLGAYVEATKALPMEALENALAKRLIGHRGEWMLDLDKKALKAGAKFVTDATG